MRHGRTLRVGKPTRLWNRTERRASGRDKPKTKRLRPVKPPVWAPDPPTRAEVSQEMDRRRRMWQLGMLVLILAALAAVPWETVAAWTM